MCNHPGHFIDISFQINGYAKLTDNLKTPVRRFGTVNIWRDDGTAHPFQLKDCLYVPDLKSSLVCKNEIASVGNPCMEMLKYFTLSL